MELKQTKCHFQLASAQPWMAGPETRSRDGVFVGASWLTRNSHPWRDVKHSWGARPSHPWLGVRQLRVTLVTLRIPGSPLRERKKELLAILVLIAGDGGISLGELIKG